MIAYKAKKEKTAKAMGVFRTKKDKAAKAKVMAAYREK